MQQREDNWAQPPPHPGDRRALTPITERSTRDSVLWDANPGPLHRPGFAALNGSSTRTDQIQKQPSETSQDLPKLQTDAESSTFLGDALVTSPASHLALHEFNAGRTGSPGSLGSKPDDYRSKQEPVSLPKPDSGLHSTHPSTDAIRLVESSKISPINSPTRESVLPAPPSPHSNQLVHPSQSVLSDIPRAPPKSPDRPAFTSPIRERHEAESGSPIPMYASVRRERDTSGFPTTPTKPRTPDPALHPQTDPHPSGPTFSPTPTTVNSPLALTHTTTATSTTSRSEYSVSSGGAKPSSSIHVQGMFSSPSHFNRGSHSQSPSYSTSQSQRAVEGESSQKESQYTSISEDPEEVKPVKHVSGGREGSSSDSHGLLKEAGALYYMQEIQDATVVQPPRIVGRGQNIPIASKGLSDDEVAGGPSTKDKPQSLPQQTQIQPPPRPLLPPEPQPLQVKRPSSQAKASLPPSLPEPPSQHPAPPSPQPSQSQHQNYGYAQAREQQPILAPQPQQPVTSSFNPVKTMEGDVRTSDLSYPGSDTSGTSPVDSRRTSIIGHGGSIGGGRPGLVSRPSGARDPVQKQRGGTIDSISSPSRHNGQPQPRHPLPPHPESSSEQPSPYPAFTQPSHHQGRVFAQALDDTTQQTNQGTGTVKMADVNQRQLYEDNSDALAALTFLERDEAGANIKPPPPPPPPIQGRTSPTLEPATLAYDAPPVHVTPSDSRDDVSQDSGSYEGKFKSSFAPSKQATQRLAKTQAQQAAHQAAVHRPGKSGGLNGKGKRRAGQDGWVESSDDDDDDEEEDEDVDSDGDPVAPRRNQGPGPGPGQNLGRLSTQGSPYGSTSDLGHHGQGKSQRNLPRPPSPGRGYGTYFLPGEFSLTLVSY